MSKKKGLSQQAVGKAARLLYHDWLKARAALEDPDEDPSDATTKKLDDELVRAERALLLADAANAAMVWKKIEILEHFLAHDLVEDRALVALFGIKADLKRLWLGERMG
jgi:hypothetical protein